MGEGDVALTIARIYLESEAVSEDLFPEDTKFMNLLKLRDFSSSASVIVTPADTPGFTAV